MEKISYKLKILILYTISVAIVVALLYNLFTTFTTTNIGTISKDNFKNKSLEREKYLNDFFYPYITTIKATQQSNIIQQYLSNELPKKTIESYFLDIKRSLPCLTQVRLLDIKGKEQIRIEGTPIELFKEKAISKIVSSKMLQDKSNRTYFKNFLLLKQGEIGFSKIGLNKEYGKVIFPKQPTLKLGVGIYDKLGNHQGILVFNLCLRTFFKAINKTTLYYVHLIDNQGNYLSHHTSKYGLLGDNPNYTIFDEHPKHAKKILLKDNYFGDYLYSMKIDNLENGQNIKLLLELKFHEVLQESKKTKESFIFYAFIFAIVLFAIALYMAHLPDYLRKNAQKEKLINKLTSLPNRFALMEDLAKNEFQHSLVILISANNLLKIQNTYGYTVSNSLVKQLAKYLKEYNNGIEKVYVNGYNIFGLKYHYTHQKSLDNFLQNLINAIEDYPFTINIDNNEVEFLIEVTLGVSDPFVINNTIEELNEAENALEYAHENSKQLEIFSSSHHENIQGNKENLLLAKKIKKAIDKDSIILHYQPIYNNTTQKIEKYESLIRMKYEESIIYPDKFLPIAKQIKKYNTLSYIVIDKAFQYFKDKNCEFSINISILDIENVAFQKYLFERLHYYGISDQLVLEIVEQEGVENYEQFFKFIKKVKQYGCKIAIDDFGSGYSNYEYIISASDYIDYLKLDGSIIKNLPTNPKTQVLVGSLKFLCDNLGIQTIAEYVEDEEVLKYVTSIGIDYSQGYHIGKPKQDIEYFE